jgi:hypothetical protein
VCSIIRHFSAALNVLSLVKGRSTFRAAEAKFNALRNLAFAVDFIPPVRPQ